MLRERSTRACSRVCSGISGGSLPYLFFYTGGFIIISHPLGRKWLNEVMHVKDPVAVPHLLPDQAQLEALISDLPLSLHSYVDEEQLYIATLQVSTLSLCIRRSTC